MAARGGVEAIATLLEVLSSPVRLEILHQAREPRPIADLRVTAGRSRQGEQPHRPLARQTVAHHVEQLLAAGLLLRLPRPAGADAVLVDHARLFALVDELRTLAKVQPLYPTTAAGVTLAAVPTSQERRLPAPPRLLVAYGRDDGLAFALHGPIGTRWRLGRARRCEICLDYDPYASSENAVVERTAKGFVLHDTGSRNGTWLDWERLPTNGTRPLIPGSMLVVGRSILVFQAAP